LIFSIGILVDDAIVVVENMVRHFRLPESHGRPMSEVAVEAVAEVGNPTILATFAVIAAVLPMAFVRGLMGPYMRPIPVGASAAMLFSLMVAFVVSPWAALRLLGKHLEGAKILEPETENWRTRIYRRIMTPLIQSGRNRTLFFIGVAVLLLASVARKDAAVRQQERTAGGDQYAGRHAAGTDRAGCPGIGRRTWPPAGCVELSDLYRNVRTL
jgi:multidrug efflux pump subunit AcrB